MEKKVNSRDPLWVNRFLLVAIILSLTLGFITAHQAWKEDWALQYSGAERHSQIIADMIINLSGVPRREHCLTCHPQGKRGNLRGKPAALRPHPDISPHSIYELGCTGCHLGEGMARDLVISHGIPGMEAQKVLTGEGLQASCYRCHELKPLHGAEKAWEGYHLFSSNACVTCHNVYGSEGGRYGPDLSHIGSFLGLRQIQAAIEEPKADPENSIMPRFSLSPEQIKAISYFLKSQTKEPFNETPLARMVKIKEQTRVKREEERKVAGMEKEILKEKKCLACHKFHDEDGQIAPDLTYIAFMRKEDYIKNFLRNPAKEIPGAVMPWVRLTPEEEERILWTLQKRERGDHLPGKSPKHIYMALCQRCHAAQGDGFGTIQPNLANFPRAFWKNAEFFRRIAEERIVKSIEWGIPGTSMPPYGQLLGRDSINSLVDLIFKEFIRIKRNEKRTDLSLPSRPAALLPKEETEKEYRKYCSSCHGIAGTGKGLEYLRHLPRPRNLTNRPYFRSLTDDEIALTIVYGVPGTAMPSFGGKISRESIWSLVEKIREFSSSHGK